MKRYFIRLAAGVLAVGALLFAAAPAKAAPAIIGTITITITATTTTAGGHPSAVSSTPRMPITTTGRTTTATATRVTSTGIRVAPFTRAPPSATGGPTSGSGSPGEAKHGADADERAGVATLARSFPGGVPARGSAAAVATACAAPPAPAERPGCLPSRCRAGPRGRKRPRGTAASVG